MYICGKLVFSEVELRRRLIDAVKFIGDVEVPEVLDAIGSGVDVIVSTLAVTVPEAVEVLHAQIQLGLHTHEGTDVDQRRRHVVEMQPIVQISDVAQWSFRKVVHNMLLGFALLQKERTAKSLKRIEKQI